MPDGSFLSILSLFFLLLFFSSRYMKYAKVPVVVIQIYKQRNLAFPWLHYKEKIKQNFTYQSYTWLHFFKTTFTTDYVCEDSGQITFCSSTFPATTQRPFIFSCHLPSFLDTWSSITKELEGISQPETCSISKIGTDLKTTSWIIKNI